MIAGALHYGLNVDAEVRGGITGSVRLLRHRADLTGELLPKSQIEDVMAAAPRAQFPVRIRGRLLGRLQNPIGGKSTHSSRRFDAKPLGDLRDVCDLRGNPLLWKVLVAGHRVEQRPGR